jgi:O-antigen/teichoic acid export membrane protein
VRNLAVQSGTQVVALGISVVSVGVLARALGVDGNGQFGYAFAFVFFLLTFADPGISTVVSRDLAAAGDIDATLLQRVLGLRLVMACAVMVAGWVVAFTAIDPVYRWPIVVFSFILPIQAASVGALVFMTRVMVRDAAVVEMTNRLTGFVLVLAAAWAGLGVVGVMAALVVGELAGAGVIAWRTREWVRWVPRLDASIWRQVIRGAVAVGALSFVSALINRLDYFMLESMSTVTAVGLYEAAYRLPRLAEKLPLLAMATVFPLMSRLAASDVVELRRVYRWSLARAAGLALVMLVVVQATASWVLPLWQGEAYRPAVPALRWLIVSSALMYLSLTAGNMLIALRASKPLLGVWTCAALVNVACNWWWIPRYGATGAAAATAVCFAVATIGVLWLAERVLTQRLDV